MQCMLRPYSNGIFEVDTDNFLFYQTILKDECNHITKFFNIMPSTSDWTAKLETD